MEKKALSNFCVVGFPDDLGIRNLNGRLGASDGPLSFVDAFQRINGKKDLHAQCQSISMVSIGNQIETNHKRAIAEVKRVCGKASSGTLIAVGGGHDYAYSWIRGIAKSRKTAKKIGCINIDAHFDTRDFKPVMTSGSPFRRLIDEKVLDPKCLIEFGIQSHCNRPELWDYAKKVKIQVVPFEKLRAGKAVRAFKQALLKLNKTCSEILISVDLDALSLAHCPGVSAPQGEGFTASELYQMLEIAGSDKKVTSLGIFELSPPLDVQDHTSRVAAQAAWHFLSTRP